MATNEVADQIDASKRRANLRRFFSTDSNASSFRYPSYLQPMGRKEYVYRLCNRELALKLIQLLMAIISSGLYSRGLFVMPYDKTKESTITNLMFPNVVFSSFIIITSVIAISYVLGQGIPDVITRIFCVIGMILHFISACITTIVWCKLSDTEIEKSGDGIIAARMLFAQIFTTALNSFLYGLDLFLSLRKVLKYDSVDTSVENAPRD